SMLLVPLLVPHRCPSVACRWWVTGSPPPPFPARWWGGGGGRCLVFFGVEGVGLRVALLFLVSELRFVVFSRGWGVLLLLLLRIISVLLILGVFRLCL